MNSLILRDVQAVLPSDLYGKFLITFGPRKFAMGIGNLFHNPMKIRYLGLDGLMEGMSFAL
jgi:hypothetical protein